MAAIFCEKHPAYGVLAAPNSSCQTCARMWERRTARKVCANPKCKKVFCWEGDSNTKYHSYRCSKEVVRNPELPPAEQVVVDREKGRLTNEVTLLRGKYAESLKTIDRLEKENRFIDSISGGIDTYTIEPRKGLGDSEGTVVMPASDWHIEEKVDPRQVSGLNAYNLDIAKKSVETFFQAGLRLTRLLQQDITINNLVLPLLGDFISNDIHEEFPENNQLLPIDAILMAQNFIASGLEFLLNHSKLNIVVPCHSGNHARTTKTVRSASENGHSLEYFMYQSLAGYFRSESRLKFIIPDGYHSYMDIYDKHLRFHHGHDIRYQGGVGGIYIPVNKAIAQWNKASVARSTDLDVFGHFHQARDGGNFVSNGSIIGYNSFALRNKFDFDEPKQQLFLIDKRRGRTCAWPILVRR